MIAGCVIPHSGSTSLKTAGMTETAIFLNEYPFVVHEDHRTWRLCCGGSRGRMRLWCCRFDPSCAQGVDRPNHDPVELHNRSENHFWTAFRRSPDSVLQGRRRSNAANDGQAVPRRPNRLICEELRHFGVEDSHPGQNIHRNVATSRPSFRS